MVSGNGGGMIANKAGVRLVNYGVMALFISIKLETIICKTIEYLDYCHANRLMYKLLTSKSDEYEGCLFIDQRERDSQLKAAQRRYMNMIIKTKDLFGLIKDLEKIIYGIGFKLIIKRNGNDRVLLRVNAGALAEANNCKIEIRDIAWCLSYFNLSNYTKE